MAENNKTIVLFTRWFPYNKWNELSFLEDEIIAIDKRHLKLILVPQKIIGEKYELNPTIKVEESLSTQLNEISFRDKFSTIFSFTLFRELLRVKFNRKKIRHATSTYLSALIVRNWMDKLFDKEEEIVFYSFWMDYSTLGAIMSASLNKNWKVVSRCHNFDLYGNDANSYYVPFQSLMMSSLNAVYPDSKAGEEFILSRFKVRECIAQLMGVSEPLRLNERANDSIFRIFSCSHMIPRKRVPLILKGMIELANREKSRNFIWSHVGEGEEMDLIMDILKDKPSNLEVKLLGRFTNEELREFYLNNSIDIFINVSEKEGTPVSLMEALSYGIPVMASSFGGNKEVVESSNGLGISESPTKEEIASEIQEFIRVDNFDEHRKNAFRAWDLFYNSKRNYNEFCNRLEKI